MPCISRLECGNVSANGSSVNFLEVSILLSLEPDYFSFLPVSHVSDRFYGFFKKLSYCITEVAKLR